MPGTYLGLDSQSFESNRKGIVSRRRRCASAGWIWARPSTWTWRPHACTRARTELRGPGGLWGPRPGGPAACAGARTRARELLRLALQAPGAQPPCKGSVAEFQFPCVRVRAQRPSGAWVCKGLAAGHEASSVSARPLRPSGAVPASELCAKQGACLNRCHRTITSACGEARHAPWRGQLRSLWCVGCKSR